MHLMLRHLPTERWRHLVPLKHVDIKTNLRFLIVLIVTLVLSTVPRAVGAQDSAVTIMYSKIGSADGASTEISMFENHLAYLSSGNYQVMPLPQILATLRNGGAIPQDAIAITFDGGDRSIYTEAWPRLKNLGFTFTVFIATDFVDTGSADYMTWDHLRELASSGITIGTLGARYNHLATIDETDASQDIARANQRITDEIGTAPELFAYPFGEYSASLQRIVANYGHSAAFGQHSGVVHSGSDYLALPRYPLISTYSSMSRFKTIVDTLPLPITDLVPTDPLLADNPPTLGFTVAADVGSLERLACYLGGVGKLITQQLGPSRIEVRFPSVLPKGRNRINCTLPGPESRWRWFGLQFLVTE